MALARNAIDEVAEGGTTMPEGQTFDPAKYKQSSTLLKNGQSGVGRFIAFYMIGFMFALPSCSQEIIWEKLYTRYPYNTVVDMKHTSDGGYVVAGVIEFKSDRKEWSNTYLLKLDAMGKFCVGQNN